MKLTLISPRLALQKGDFLGSGVPYWPLELATLAAHARQVGDVVKIVDQFGENPSLLSDAGDHYLQGVSIDAPIWYEDLKFADAFILYAISFMSHAELLTTAKWLKSMFPSKKIAVLENSQAVTAYSLSRMATSFLNAGADVLICGEPYSNWHSIKRCFYSDKCYLSLAPNVITRYSGNRQVKRAEKLDRYPTPAWDLIKLNAYWRLPYSHGPKTAKFLPIITSRGCPYPCDFCVVPETNNRRWRGNDPEHVVQEIIELRDKYGVNDFQVEDLNPTVQHLRWERICELLIEREANIRFYFVSGTKAETVHIDKVSLFAKAGCRYISISPESGSPDLMKVIGKKFNQKHGLDLVKQCRKFGIRTQACFLVGHPQETVRDYLSSKDYLIKLVQGGLDEVAIFVVAPFAGSSLFAHNAISVEGTTALTSFSPKGRSNYEILEARRKTLILSFFTAKLRRGSDLWMQGLRSIFGVPETKMENLPRRVAYITWLLLRQRCFSLLRGCND
jgi:biotin synthase-like enzyme